MERDFNRKTYKKKQNVFFNSDAADQGLAKRTRGINQSARRHDRRLLAQPLCLLGSSRLVDRVHRVVELLPREGGQPAATVGLVRVRVRATARAANLGQG